jgi:hypothetical protein
VRFAILSFGEIEIMSGTPSRILRVCLVAGVVFSVLIDSEIGAAKTAVSPDLAPEQASVGQYHLSQTPVSPAVFGPVSSVQFAVDSSAYLPADRTWKVALDSRNSGTASQYHSEPALLVAVALGVIYAVFLAVWFWATRMRSPRR